VQDNLEPERAAVIRTYCEPREMPSHITVTPVGTGDDGRIDLADLGQRLNDNVAALYLETPNSLGVIERDVEEVVHAAGAELILGVDPISLGVLAPPGQLNADIAVGSTQPLGVHMNCGGGAGGFIASRDEERYARAYPTLQVSIAPTIREGEHGFTMTLFEQSSYGRRELGNDWTGNSVYLWAIVNAVYMSLLGPQGFQELGERILQRSHYAASRIDELPNASVRHRGFFKEFVVDFEQPVSEVNAALRARGIFGGGAIAPNSALYCVTEVHAQDDIDRLVEALAEVTA
jgi:glycine cleavage system P protein (glycine dehydrogenase) subunit 1